MLTADVVVWVEKCDIGKGDGTKYATSSVSAISSNSDIENELTTNENKKVLTSRKGENGKKYMHLLKPEKVQVKKWHQLLIKNTKILLMA